MKVSYLTLLFSKNKAWKYSPAQFDQVEDQKDAGNPFFARPFKPALDHV
jgi:hypothetical protein